MRGGNFADCNISDVSLQFVKFSLIRVAPRRRFQNAPSKRSMVFTNNWYQLDVALSPAQKIWEYIVKNLSYQVERLLLLVKLI